MQATKKLERAEKNLAHLKNHSELAVSVRNVILAVRDGVDHSLQRSVSLIDFTSLKHQRQANVNQTITEEGKREKEHTSG